MLTVSLQLNNEAIQSALFGAIFTGLFGLLVQALVLYGAWRFFQGRQMERERNDERRAREDYEWREYVKRELENLTSNSNKLDVARAGEKGNFDAWAKTLNELGREVLDLRNYKHAEVIPGMRNIGLLHQRVQHVEENLRRVDEARR